MSLDSITPPPPEEQDDIHIAASSDSAGEVPSPVVLQRPVQFSYVRWAVTGFARLLYRSWTRVAARFFP